MLGGGERGDVQRGVAAARRDVGGAGPRGAVAVEERGLWHFHQKVSLKVNDKMVERFCQLSSLFNENGPEVAHRYMGGSRSRGSSFVGAVSKRRADLTQNSNELTQKLTKQRRKDEPQEAKTGCVAPPSWNRATPAGSARPAAPVSHRGISPQVSPRMNTNGPKGPDVP